MVHETILSKMVKDFGDIVLTTITNDIYGSGLAALAVFVFGVGCLIHLAFSLQKGTAPTKSLMFFCAWAACIPVAGKPLAYSVVNGLGTSIAYAIQKSTVKILSGSTSSRTMAPGWVINALIRSANVELDHPMLEDRLSFILNNCIPNANNFSGDPLTARDLFSPRSGNSRSASTSHREAFDPQILRNRHVKFENATTNCYDLLVATRSGIRHHLRGKDLTQMAEKLYISPSSGEPLANGVEKTQWREPNSPEAMRLKNVALNLATASAIRKSVIGNKTIKPSAIGFTDSYARTLATATHAQVAESTSNANLLTSITFDIMSTPMAVMRSLEVDGAISSGMLLQEMNEKLMSLPYFIAFVQNMLKILAPIAVLTLLLGTFKVFFTWSFVWILTLIMPAIINLSRGISNSILIHTNKLDQYADVLSSEPGFLAMGLNFSAANQIVEDSSRMMMTFLSVEIGVWSALMLMVPAGAWFAGNLANQAVRTVGGSIISGVAFGTGQAAYRRAVGVATKVAAPVTATAASLGQRAISSGMRSASYAYKAATFNKPINTISTQPESNIKKHLEEYEKKQKQEMKP